MHTPARKSEQAWVWQDEGGERPCGGGGASFGRADRVEAEESAESAEVVLRGRFVAEVDAFGIVRLQRTASPAPPPAAIRV
jgi:hypothetical protein